MTIVTLLTDFGPDDTYVGQMKGAILAVAPRATLVDLSHAVQPQDVEGGAFFLWSSVDAFPARTVHLAVVDPGVGSPRRAIALRAGRGDLFVGPDNGVLIPAAERLGGVEQTVELTNSRFWRRLPTSTTFHGRDIFGPVAGHLSAGARLEALGQTLENPVHLAIPWPTGLHGQVIHVDTYGNLVTNFPAASMPRAFYFRVGSMVVAPAAYYAAVEPGSLLALVGSAGLWEIAARDASAARLTAARRGTPVEVEPV